MGALGLQSRGNLTFLDCAAGWASLASDGLARPRRLVACCSRSLGLTEGAAGAQAWPQRDR